MKRTYFQISLRLLSVCSCPQWFYDYYKHCQRGCGQSFSSATLCGEPDSTLQSMLWTADLYYSSSGSLTYKNCTQYTKMLEIISPFEGVVTSLNWLCFSPSGQISAVFATSRVCLLPFNTSIVNMDKNRHYSRQARPYQVRWPIGSTFEGPHSVARTEIFEGGIKSYDRNRCKRAWGLGALAARVWGLKPLLELGILQKLYYLRKGGQMFSHTFAC